MKWSKLAVPLLLAATAGATVWGVRGLVGQSGWKGLPYVGTQDTEMAAYKTDTVRSGSVAVTISEDGSIAFGTLEQTFSLSGAETIVSTSADSASASSSGQSQSRGGGSTGGMGTGSSDSSISGNGGSGGGGSSASGSSQATESQSLTLEVEEVYLKAGQVVQEGDPVLKFTQDSIDTARSTLESALHTAELKVRQEEINTESAKAEADYNYNLYLVEGKTAQATYEATLARLDKAVADLEEDLAESQELIDEYQELVDDGDEDYEDELEDEQERYEDLQDELIIAQNNRTTQSIEAKKAYEEAMTNYRYADQLYAIDTDGLEDSLSEAQAALADAQEALADFEEAVGNGTLTAEAAGTVSTVSCAAGDTLSDGSVIMDVTDSSDVTMTVLVSQEDIPNISVGDSAQISLDAFAGQTFTGEVSSIETTASMGSSTVNYSVGVALTGDVSRIYAGMTGEAVFGIQSEEDVLYVSNAAVHQDGARIYVKVLEQDGTTSEQDVQTGFSNGKNVAILEGLTEGQTVVIER